MTEANESRAGSGGVGPVPALAATVDSQAPGSPVEAPAKLMAESLLESALAYVRGDDMAARLLPSGETVLAHAEGSLQVVTALRVDEEARAAAVLFPVAWEHARAGNEIDGTLRKRFGHEVADLVRQAGKLLAVGDKAVDGSEYLASRNDSARRMAQVEALRKMLLAFADDIRVVLIRLASRLQTLRWHAQSRQEPPPPGLALETLDLYAPLANRLGIWQLKWELEDLALRFEHPDIYKQIARMLDEKRVEREAFVAGAIGRLLQELQAAGIVAEVSGRPKHIYSIWKKMRGKALDFSELHDVRAFRVIVDDIKDCYTALGIVHNLWQPVPREFDDYISRPKPNGYKSLHTVVIGDDGRALEVQIRTHEMHHFAEYGVAAHWRYKEAGTKGYGGQVSAAGRYDERIAWVRQLLAWRADAERGAAQSGDVERQVPGTPDVEGAWEQLKHTEIDDHIYVLTPQARIIALPQHATPVDFAYYLHSDLGHRCRGARVDGAMVPLNTPLQNGQTVEVITVKQGGPSRDWLNPELGYLVSPRARAKVRAWFNALELEETVAHGRALIDKTLQREGRTAVKLEELAHRLGFKNPEALFAQVAKDEFSLRHVEQALRERPAQPAADEEGALVRASRATSVARGAHPGILVLGVGALMTHMARCCKPAPPDAIVGFVTVGKGVSIHRGACKTFAQLAARAPQRVIETQWGAQGGAVYPIDFGVQATDRHGLLRDISEVLVREKINVTGVRTYSKQGTATMRFTAEIGDAGQLQRALNLIAEVRGVLSAWRA